VRKQYAREYRERRRLFNIVQVWYGQKVTAPVELSRRSESDGFSTTPPMMR